MADYAVINDALTDTPPPAPQEPYIYQTLHAAAGRPLNTAAHLRTAAAAAREMFGAVVAADAVRADALCRRMLQLNRYPTGVSSSVRLRIYASGEVRWECGEILVHDGMVLRPIRPDAVSVRYDIPLGEAPTSAREAAHLLVAADVRRRGYRSAVRFDMRGTALTADDAPLFVVRDRCVCTSPARSSVERDLAVLSVRAAGLELREEPVDSGMLRRADEVFMFDFRGITSLSSCDGVPYMDILTRRIARCIVSRL